MSITRSSGLVRRLTLGVVAGAVGTAAMDLLLYRRYRSGGGKDPLGRWEFAGNVTSWDEASAPGQIGQKVERLITRTPPPERWARTTTNVFHWATGISWGVQYALLAGKRSGHPLGGAVALGPVAWLSSYVILPLTGVYQPIWKYDARTLADDLSAHLVFGTTTSATLTALSRRGSR
jgi:hypothetical protein